MYANLIMFILREKLQVIHIYLCIYTYIGSYHYYSRDDCIKENYYIQAKSVFVDLSIKIHHQLDFQDGYSLFLLLL